MICVWFESKICDVKSTSVVLIVLSQRIWHNNIIIHMNFNGHYGPIMKNEKKALERQNLRLNKLCKMVKQLQKYYKQNLKSVFFFVQTLCFHFCEGTNLIGVYQCKYVNFLSTTCYIQTPCRQALISPSGPITHFLSRRNSCLFISSGTLIYTWE